MHLMVCDLGASVVLFASAYVAIDELKYFPKYLKMVCGFLKKFILDLFWNRNLKEGYLQTVVHKLQNLQVNHIKIQHMSFN